MKLPRNINGVQAVRALQRMGFAPSFTPFIFVEQGIITIVMSGQVRDYFHFLLVSKRLM